MINEKIALCILTWVVGEILIVGISVMQRSRQLKVYFLLLNLVCNWCRKRDRYGCTLYSTLQPLMITYLYSF